MIPLDYIFRSMSLRGLEEISPMPLFVDHGQGGKHEQDKRGAINPMDARKC
jgi:hypothetical protein